MPKTEWYVIDLATLLTVAGGQSESSPTFFDWWRDVPPPVSTDPPGSVTGSTDGLAGRSFCERRPRLCAELGMLPKK